MRRGCQRCNIEAAQHLDFVAFHVDREEIEARGRAGLLKHAVERPDRHFDDGFGRGARRHARAVERGQRTGHMQRQRVPGIVGRGTGNREDLGGALGAQFAARSGCGSMRMPVQPACSRCQVCDRSRGSLAPTSTKYPCMSPKNAATSRIS